MSQLSPRSQSDSLWMTRSEFVEVIEQASFMVPDRTRERLRVLAQTTDRVAVGWFHCDGVGCPARQIGYRSQAFQSAYDSRMAKFFDLEVDWEDSALAIDPVVVEIRDDRPPLLGAGGGEQS